MPSPQSILADLTVIANEGLAIAIAWHGITLAAVAALLLGWRPSRRLAGILLAAPIASASILAFIYANPFNGTLLGALAVSLIAIAARLGSARVRRGSTGTTALGVALIAFGWVYPHFLASGAAVAYLFAAPTGLLPCPTLSLVIGFALLAGGLKSRAWSGALGLAGLFYGLFGVLGLGVLMDGVLVGGALVLVVVALRLRPVQARGAGTPAWSGLPVGRRSAPPIR